MGLLSQAQPAAVSVPCIQAEWGQRIERGLACSCQCHMLLAAKQKHMRAIPCLHTSAMALLDTHVSTALQVRVVTLAG